MWEMLKCSRMQGKDKNWQTFHFVIGHLHDRTHAPGAIHWKTIKIYQNMKEQPWLTMEPPQQILLSTTGNVTPAFLLVNNGPSPNRMLILGITANLQLLITNPNWFMTDSTRMKASVAITRSSKVTSLRSTARTSLAAVPVLDEIKDTYIGVHADRRHSICRMWNMFNRSCVELPRTNNLIEGWHHSFQAGIRS